MANYKFYVDEYASELKQHLNLSEETWLTIEEDIKNFYDSDEKETFSGFLNRVFRNFYQQADASISLRYMEKADELEKLYSSPEFSSFDKKTIKMFIDKYAHVYESELKAKALSYPSGHGKKFRIDKDSLAILKESLEADYYDNTIGLYLKAIFEEYASKPRYIREQIFFGDTLAEINEAIEKQKKLKISLLQKVSVDGKIHYVRKFYALPYKIVQDKTDSYNYLIGYSEQISEVETEDETGKKIKTSTVSEKTPCCFRLSRIEKISLMSSMGAHISKESSSQLDKMLIERTAMFMSSEVIDIKVRFTEKGLESFRRQIYLRPQLYEIDKEDKHIYIFHCTDVQALNYFFKFGWDTEILEPFYLREKFIKRYYSALKTYQGATKGELIEERKKQRKKANRDNII